MLQRRTPLEIIGQGTVPPTGQDDPAAPPAEPEPGADPSDADAEPEPTRGE